MIGTLHSREPFLRSSRSTAARPAGEFARAARATRGAAAASRRRETRFLSQMEGAAAEGADASWVVGVPLVASGDAAEEAPVAAEAPAPKAEGGGKAPGATRPQDVTERSTPRFLRSLHQARRVRGRTARGRRAAGRSLTPSHATQALFGPGTRDNASAVPDADDANYLESLNDAIGKTETELHKRQGAVQKPPDRTAERYWSQFWLAVLHGEEPLSPTVVAMRRTAKDRMTFETAKYQDSTSGKLDMFYAVACACQHWPASRARRALTLARARRARSPTRAHPPCHTRDPACGPNPRR
jgi:hypothetical protein